MNKKILTIATLGSILAFTQSLTADDSSISYAKEGFYVGTELGGTVVPNIDLGSGVQLDTNPGIRFDVPLGYRVNEWFSLEFAPGFMWNSLNSFKVDSGESISTGGSLWQVPLLVNFILTIPTNSKWEPFLGGGVGGLYASANFDEYAGISIPERSLSSWALGYSALAGLNYHLTKDISFGFNYKFTGTGTQNWSGDVGEGLSTKIYTHSASLSATFRF